MTSSMTTIVRRYTREIRNGRTPSTIIRHMRGEVEELQEEIDGTGDGRDGIVGESIDIIACALDMIFEVQPDITDEEIDSIMEAKCAKWARKVTEGAYDTEDKEPRVAIPSSDEVNAAIAAYNKVWENSGSIDANNVAKIREAAIRAVLSTAGDDTTRKVTQVTDRFSTYIGKHYDEISEIQAAHPLMNVQFIPAGSAVTMDFREDRIRVWYNIDTKMVTRITVG